MNYCAKIWNRIVRNGKSGQNCGLGGKRPQRRRLRLENLEERALLAVTPGAELASISANTSTLVVTTLNDLIDASDEVLSLREAIAAASDGDRITFKTNLDGGTIYLSGTELAIERGISIDASSLSNGVTIYGNNSRIFYVTGGTAESQVKLSHLTLANGYVNGSGGAIYNAGYLFLNQCEIRDCRTYNGSGGAIYHNGASLSLLDCALTNNGTDGSSNNGESYSGGGIYCAAGNFTLTGCTLTSNYCYRSNSNGGAIYCAAENFTMTDCALTYNYCNSSNSNGGGVYSASENFTMTGCTLTSNYCDNSNSNGGAIYCAAGNFAMTDCTLTGNHCNNSNSNGGGVYSASKNFTMTGCTLTSNYCNSNSNGGAIYCAAGNFAMTDCTLTGNHCNNGGAIYNDSIVLLTDCALSGNEAYSCGDGIYNRGQLTLDECRLSNQYDVIYNDEQAASLTMTDCISTDVGIIDDSLACRIILTGCSFTSGEGIVIDNGDNASVISLTNCAISYSNYGIFTIYIQGQLTLQNCSLLNNNYAGLYINDGRAAVTLEHCIISGNGDKGIYNNASTTLTLTDCTITGNNGNGIYNNGNSTLTLMNCDISGNAAAICNSGTMTLVNYKIAKNRQGIVNSGSLTLINCAVVDNNDLGIRNSGTLRLYNCTVAGNYNGGIDNSKGKLYLYNTIAAQNNLNNPGSDYDISGGSVYGEYSLSTYQMGGTNLLFDKSRSLFKAGGYALCAGSQAIDAGVNEYVSTSSDLGGNRRMINGVVDMGAYEFGNVLSGINIFGYSGVYDGLYHGVTLTGTRDGDEITYSADRIAWSPSPLLTKNAGEQTVYVRVIRNNESLWSGSANVVITPKTLTVSGSAVNDKIYDGSTTASVTVGTVKGAFSGDQLTVSGHGSFESANVGSYAVAVEYTLSGADAENYIAPVSETFSARITKAPIQTPSLALSARGPKVTLTWDAVENADQYRIEYAEDSSFEEISIKSTSETNAVISGLELGVTYYFRIKAKNNSGNYFDSDYSAAQSVTISADPLETPAHIVLTAKASKITAAWEAVENANRYLVEYSDDPNFEELIAKGTTETSLTFSGFQVGVTYYFRVTAKDTNGVYPASDPSEVKSITITEAAIPLDVPTGLAYASAGANRALLTWNAVDNAERYAVSYSADGENWSRVTSAGTAVTVTGLTYGTLYTYKVRTLASESGDYCDSEDSAVISYYVCPMDINSDGKINLLDFRLFGASFATREGDENYDTRCDIDGNGKINLSDFSYLNKNFGKSLDDPTIVYPAPLAELPEDIFGLDLDFVKENVNYNTLAWELEVF